MKPRKQIRDVSEKRAAKLAAKGVKLYGSSIAPSSKPKKPKAIGRGPMMQRRSGVKPKARKPIAKLGKQKAKRQARNRAYYASSEWRAKRKAVFQRDGYQCTETLQWLGAGTSSRCASRRRDHRRLVRRRRRCVARHSVGARPRAAHRDQSRQGSDRAPRGEPSGLGALPRGRVARRPGRGVPRPKGRAHVAVARLQALLESEGRQAGLEEDSRARVDGVPLGEGGAAARHRARERRGVSDVGSGRSIDEWRPDPARKGHTFKRFVARLERLGYVVEWRELRACDYGAPTIRKRLFLIARCDGRPIVWPQPTHGKGRAQPWRTAAECIDWSIPCPSIFERKKALATTRCGGSRAASSGTSSTRRRRSSYNARDTRRGAVRARSPARTAASMRSSHRF
jgi:hypothetical protein